MVVIMYFNLGGRYVDILLQSFITHIDYKICILTFYSKALPQRKNKTTTLLASPPVSLLWGSTHTCVCVLSCSSRVWLFVTLWTATPQAPLSMGFSRQEYWSALPFPSPGDLPNPGIEPESLTSLALAGRSFTTSATWEAPQTLMAALT